jgi:GNAT superfamily N-acetyltransferase
MPAGTIRPARLDEAAAIARLVNLAYEVERFFVLGDRTSAEGVRTLMGRGTFLAALGPDEGLLGCLYLETAGERAEFGMLAVDPPAQGRGWGPRLVDAAEARAREAGCLAMEIRVVNLREDLFPRYRRLGYVETGVTEPYEHRPVIRACHFVVMRKPLS